MISTFMAHLLSFGREVIRRPAVPRFGCRHPPWTGPRCRRQIRAFTMPAIVDKYAVSPDHADGDLTRTRSDSGSHSESTPEIASTRDISSPTRRRVATSAVDGERLVEPGRLTASRCVLQVPSTRNPPSAVGVPYSASMG